VSISSSMITVVFLKYHSCNPSQRPKLSIVGMSRDLECNICLFCLFKMGRLMIHKNHREILMVCFCEIPYFTPCTSNHRMHTTIITTNKIYITHYHSYILEHDHSNIFQHLLREKWFSIVFMITIDTIHPKRCAKIRKTLMKSSCLYYIKPSVEYITSQKNNIRPRRIRE
jgi:hypothetical protein